MDEVARALAVGEVEEAIRRLEEMAAYGEAARVAMVAGDPRRAMRLAARAPGDVDLDEIAARLSPEEAAGLGAELHRRRFSRAAAACLARAGDSRSAARSWAEAGDIARAAQALVAAGDDVAAGRLLADRLLTCPSDTASAVALAGLCVAHGRWEAAARAAQRVTRDHPHAPHAPRARALLALAFHRLGLTHAAHLVGVPPADAPSASTGASLLFGRYEVLEVVATTPGARVIRARDRLGDTLVAVKVIRESRGGVEGRDALARFEREARALALLRHPHIVPLLAYFPQGPAIVTPWLVGGSLAAALALGPLPAARAAAICEALLGAVAEAHRIGLLHRDIKPSNILFDGTSSPYLADFGAAHVADLGATVTAGVIGTPATMSPEQVVGEPATPASDLYAIGAVLFECLTGVPAEVGASPRALHPQLESAHDLFVSSLLARSPRDRPASAHDALARLRALPRWPDRALSKPTLPERTPTAPSARMLATQQLDRFFDTELGCHVSRVARTPASLADARARARSPEASSFVLRVDDEAIWFAVPPEEEPASTGVAPA